MPAPRGPIRIISGIDDDGEIQAYGVDVEGNLFVGIYNAIAGANVASWHSIEGTGDRAALLVAGQMFYFDGTNYRRVQGEATGGVPYSGPHGWISGAWQKNPLQFGFSGPLSYSESIIGMSAGTNVMFFPVVPAGEIWVITHVSWMFLGTPPSSGQFQLARVIDDTVIFRQETPVSSRTYDRQGFWVIVEDDKAQLYLEGVTAGDDSYAWLSGYRVDIDL